MLRMTRSDDKKLKGLTLGTNVAYIEWAVHAKPLVKGMLVYTCRWE